MKTPILVVAFSNSKLKVLNYSRNCNLHATLIPNLVKPLSNAVIPDQNGLLTNYIVHTLANSGFFKNFLYQDGVTSIDSWVFEDLKFKISEVLDTNWCFPDSAQLAVSV